MPAIRRLRAFTVHQGGADYHDQVGAHWIDDRIATPLSKYPEYRASRRSFGLNVLGTLLIEVEADDGSTGYGVTTAGEPGAFIAERHFARFVEGAQVNQIERIWDQMYSASLFYGRKGLAINVISAIDLALWDLLGKLRREPVYALLGGTVRDEQPCYATGPRPDLARQLGFIGGKMPVQYDPPGCADVVPGTVRKFQAMREATAPDFWLMADCWMSLDLDHATRLGIGLHEVGVRWIEEALLPDDYWGYAELRRRLPPDMLVTSGEHEATRWGFRLLLEMGCCDIIQPDVTWCGGMTELLKISALADSRGVLVVPHGSSVFSYHFAITRHNSPFTEFLMMHPDGTEVTPMLSPLLLDEPLPEGGKLRLPGIPGFGLRLNPDCALNRPYEH